MQIDEPEEVPKFQWAVVLYEGVTGSQRKTTLHVLNCLLDAECMATEYIIDRQCNVNLAQHVWLHKYKVGLHFRMEAPNEQVMDYFEPYWTVQIEPRKCNDRSASVFI